MPEKCLRHVLQTLTEALGAPMTLAQGRSPLRSGLQGLFQTPEGPCERTDARPSICLEDGLPRHAAGLRTEGHPQAVHRVVQGPCGSLQSREVSCLPGVGAACVPGELEELPASEGLAEELAHELSQLVGLVHHDHL